jgi:hypothetical protein
MVKWPNGAENPESVCRSNERPGGFPIAAGRYPVGENGLWHSGIHIYKDKNRNLSVCPVIAGELAAYRISDYDMTVTRPAEISSGDYELLDAKEKSVYEEKEPLSRNFREQRYKIKNNLNAEEQKYLHEKNAASFFLLRHVVELSPGNPNNSSKMTFFTLYVNLLPWNDDDNGFEYKREGVFSDIDGNTPKHIPFYQKYIYTK